MSEQMRRGFVGEGQFRERKWCKTPRREHTQMFKEEKEISDGRQEDQRGEGLTGDEIAC